MIMKAYFHAPSKPLFEQLNMMTIYNLCTYSVGIFVYKCLNNMFHTHFLCFK